MDIQTILSGVSIATAIIVNLIAIIALLKRKKNANTKEENAEIDAAIQQVMINAVNNVRQIAAGKNMTVSAKTIQKVATQVMKTEVKNEKSKS